ncbi:MAG: hypothetical protein GY927_07395 [bacterium]|nr:hypothetical protein [bacterium]
MSVQIIEPGGARLVINTRKKVGQVVRAVRNIVLFAFVGATLAACSGGYSGLSSNKTSLAPATQMSHSIRPKSATVQQIAMSRPTKTVAIKMAAIVGPPSNVASKLTRKITSELKKRNINVIKGKAGYNMRGYVVSSSEEKGAKLAYIWDLKNKAGRKQTRISGEKTVSTGTGDNPWKGVNDQVIAAVASDTADQLAVWLVKKNGGVVKTATRSPGGKVRTANRPVSKTPATTASTRKANIKRVVMAMVVPVTGAPGDGKTSLTRAIKKQLYAKGIRLTSKRTDSVYQVRGVVQVGAANRGKQAIRIDWKVYDPRGKRLGTVTQKNEIPKGSLSGSWGPIAAAAAGAAANGISKLLPKKARRS